MKILSNETNDQGIKDKHLKHLYVDFAGIPPLIIEVIKYPKLLSIARSNDSPIKFIYLITAAETSTGGRYSMSTLLACCIRGIGDDVNTILGMYKPES